MTENEKLAGPEGRYILSGTAPMVTRKMMRAAIRQRRYLVDLGKAPENRWAQLLTDSWARNKARQLVHNTYRLIKGDFDELKQAYSLPSWLPVGDICAWLFKKTASTVFKIAGGKEYNREISSWGTHCFKHEEQAIMGNLSYEISSCSLCSSVAFWQPGLGMIHARNLDWRLRGIKAGTILIDFINASAGDFTVVSVPGLIGVLSAVAKGRFSATINQAPHRSLLSGKNWSGYSAPLLMRYIFEQCDTFGDALATLLENQCFAPVFIHLTGCKKGESAVIHMRPGTSNRIYHYRGKPLAVSNHEDDFEKPQYLGSKYDRDDDDSCERLEKIIKAAQECDVNSLQGAALVLKKSPVANIDTQQSMVFHPKTGNAYLQVL